MLEDREGYISPVRSPKEPAGAWRKWVGRILLFVVVAGLGYLLITQVVSPENDSAPTVEPSILVAPW